MIELNENVMTDEEIESEKAEFKKARFEHYVKKFASERCGSRLKGGYHYLQRSDFYKNIITCAFCGENMRDVDVHGEAIYEAL